MKLEIIVIIFVFFIGLTIGLYLLLKPDNNGDKCKEPCQSGYQCEKGTCVCVPQCTGKECGDDGCGGTCGTCTSATCIQNKCISCQEESDNCVKTEDCCGSGLTCVLNKCTKCSKDTAGNHCQYTRDKTCNSHGTPNDTGTCTCDPGYVNFFSQCDVLGTDSCSAEYCLPPGYSGYSQGCINGPCSTEWPATYTPFGTTIPLNYYDKTIGSNCAGTKKCPS